MTHTGRPEGAKLTPERSPIHAVLSRLKEIFSPEQITDRIFGKLLPDFIVASITFLVFYLMWRLLEKALVAVMERAKVEPTASRFVHLVLKYVVLTMGAVTALAQMGVNTGSLIASLGIAGAQGRGRGAQRLQRAAGAPRLGGG